MYHKNRQNNFLINFNKLFSSETWAAEIDRMLKMALAPPGDCKKKTRGKALQTKFIVN